MAVKPIPVHSRDNVTTFDNNFILNRLEKGSAKKAQAVINLEKSDMMPNHNQPIRQRLTSKQVTYVPPTRHAVSILFLDLGSSLEYPNLSQEFWRQANLTYLPLRQIIHENKGTIRYSDKEFVVATFDSERPSASHAQQAVNCAAQIMHKLVSINEKHRQAGTDPFWFGIAVDTNELTEQELTQLSQSPRYATSTVGSRAQTLSQLNKTTPIYTIYVSDQAYKALETPTEWDSEFLGSMVHLQQPSPVPFHAILHQKI